MWVVIMRPIRQKEKDFALIGYWNFELFKKFFKTNLLINNELLI